ncbi:hypothetical protein GGF31_003320 [Allomyces arbusculus]|nr:hypothetical protein GGF31_003320 [Allomyces arbusculus]
MCPLRPRRVRDQMRQENGHNNHAHSEGTDRQEPRRARCRRQCARSCPWTAFPTETLLQIALFCSPASLLAASRACPTLDAVSRHPLVVQRHFRVDLGALGQLVDDDRLQVLVTTRFSAFFPSPLASPDAVPAPPSRWVRDLDLSTTWIRTLAPLATNDALDLVHLRLDRAPHFFPAQQLRAPPRAPLTHLRSLSLAHTTGTNDATLHDLAATLCPRLEVLDIAFCERVTDAGLACLVMHLPRLRRLRLTGCVMIEGHGLVAADGEVHVAVLDVDLTAITADVLWAYAMSPSVRYVNARACPFVTEEEGRELVSAFRDDPRGKVLHL